MAEKYTLRDIKPKTPVGTLKRPSVPDNKQRFRIHDVAPATGFAPSFIRRVIGRKPLYSVHDTITLLDQDSYSETFIKRSQVVDYLLGRLTHVQCERNVSIPDEFTLLSDDASTLIERLPDNSVQTVVTSTPYWALRIYDEICAVEWADGEVCPYGHEQTPEGFLRHTTEILLKLQRVLTVDASVWWNLMDTFNTRTQIRGNAVEALRAMQGHDNRSWHDYAARRHSAGHAYLKDGEQCMIPSLIAHRASRIGYHVKSIITWAKTSSLPEPQESRVSRNLEYILHLSPVRTPRFHKEAYRRLPAALGGRNNGWETDKLSDVWTLPTSSGRDGHGAQFPPALPGRCIALSTDPGDLVLDPFVGAGNSGVAARALGRRFLGTDVCKPYLETARRKLHAASPAQTSETIERIAQRAAQESLL